MIQITVPARELYDEVNQIFIKTKEQKLSMEHSLVSISKWESKWHKPYFAKERKTIEETIDYIRCMTITQNVDPYVYYSLTDENFTAISNYIDDPMTATWFNDSEKKSANKEIITSEIIYYWMISLNIPLECQKWHISRLLTLIRVCEIKNQPDKKMSLNEVYARNKELNEARRKKLNTKG